MRPLPLAMLIVAVCCVSAIADDRIDTPAGVIELIAPVGFDSAQVLVAGPNQLAKIRVKGEAKMYPSATDVSVANVQSVDGYSYCVFWTGSKLREIPFTCQTPTNVIPFLVAVRGSGPHPPDPDPDGPPNLNTRARWIYDKAIAVNLPAESRAYADAYGSVAAQIGAGTVTDLTTARTKLTAAIREGGQQFGGWSGKWRPLNESILKVFNDDAQTMVAAHSLMADCQAGFAAAGEQ